MNDTALLAIDVQVNMFAEGSSVINGDGILHIIERLIAQARAAHRPVVYVQNNGGEGDPDAAGTTGWQIHPDVAPETGDILIQKYTPDSFFNTNLQSELESRHIRHLIIAGMQTEFCIDATCRRVHELGYEVTLVQNAHNTYDGKGLTASQIITHCNAELRGKVTLRKTRDISFGG